MRRWLVAKDDPHDRRHGRGRVSIAKSWVYLEEVISVEKVHLFEVDPRPSNHRKSPWATLWGFKGQKPP